MNKKIVLIICLIFTFSCNREKKIIIKQNESNEYISIYNNSKSIEMDSISLDIPIEFTLNINKLSNLKSVIVHYFFDNKHLYQIDDYKIYDKKSKKIIYAIEELKKEDFPNQILIRNSNYLVSKKEAENLLRKYKIKKSINDLKLGDTIKLVPYSQFKKENRNIISDLKKIDDSIVFRINAGKKPVIVKQKINW
jgi:hypothetical protein